VSGLALRTVDLPALCVRAAITPSSIDVEARRVDLVFSTGAPVTRYDWLTGTRYIEKLSMDPAHVRLGRLNSGAPLLDTHSGYSLSSVMGVVEDDSAKLSGKKGTATVRFSRRDDVEPFWQDVQDKVIRNVSVGYIVHRYEEIPAKGDNKLATRLAVDWEPYEISMVPMPADAGAQTRDGKPATGTPASLHPCVIETRALATDAQQETATMAEERTPAAESSVERNPLDPGAPTPPAAAVRSVPAEEPNDRDRGAEAERTRVQGIMAACRAARMPQDVQDDLIARGVSLVDAQSTVFQKLRERGYDAAGPAQTQARDVSVEDHMIHVRAGIENAMLHRVAPHYFPLSDVGRRYRGMTFMDVGRAYLQAAGTRVTDLTPNQLAGAALGLTQRGVGMHTTSDFPLLLADVSSKLLRKAYEEAPQTFKAMARRVTITNYQYVNRLQLGDAPALLEIKEHGEYTSGSISEGRERYRLTKYGRKFGITREAMVNDDTQALSDIPALFGRKARAKESDLVWEQITSNPTMADGNALFSIAHGNLATTDGLIAIATLGAGRAAMRKQTGLDGEKLNLNAIFLIVPPEQETLADQFVTAVTANANSAVNPFAGKLQVISDPRLTNTAEWYLAASPDQIAWLEYAYLEGEEGPQVESRIGFDIDGVEFKCRLDFAAKVIDHRGIYKNEGGT
jgi:hypothetical protein